VLYCLYIFILVKDCLHNHFILKSINSIRGILLYMLWSRFIFVIYNTFLVFIKFNYFLVSLM